MITQEELAAIKAEIDRFPLIRHPSDEGKFIAEEDDNGVVYILREGGRQPVMMMPRAVYDEVMAYDPKATTG